MWMKFNLNIKRISETLLQDLKPKIIKASRVLYSEIIQKSPIKTWEYKWGVKIKDIKIKWKKVTWGVENIWQYSEKVETWWRKTAVNWHLVNWTIKRSKWANTFRDSLENKKDIIIKILKW